MSQQQTISEVFNTEHYTPFVRYCTKKGMIQMSDFASCSFETLFKEAGIAPGLALRIRSMIDLYRRNHPEEFMEKTNVSNEALTEKLQEFFRKNPGRVLHISEICRAVGGKKTEVQNILQQMHWCQMVDLNSYYYR